MNAKPRFTLFTVSIGAVVLVALIVMTIHACSSGAGSNEDGSDDNKWRMVGGDGVNASWDAGPDFFEEVRVLQLYQGRLYAGLVNTSQLQGQVWEYDGGA